MKTCVPVPVLLWFLLANPLKCCGHISHRNWGRYVNKFKKNQDIPSQDKKTKLSICSAFYCRSHFLLCFLPAPWKALNSKSRGQSFTQQLRGEVFPKQGTAGRLHHSYKSAVTLECVNRHISLFFFLLLCQIWLLQIPQDFLRSSNATSCLLALTFCSDLFHKNLK